MERTYAKHSTVDFSASRDGSSQLALFATESSVEHEVASGDRVGVVAPDLDAGGTVSDCEERVLGDECVAVPVAA